MRAFLLPLLFSASAAQAWDFTPSPICTLFHQGEEMSVSVTFDPSNSEYAINLSREAGWPDADVFQIRFEGARRLTISTNRHVINQADTRTLTVTDRGFGNVLNGIKFNARAVAVLGDVEVPVSLDGAAPAVDAFRTCPTDQMAVGPRPSANIALPS
ncbi:hypothetical protein MWU54_06900 [Marivita sp. S6314]|nr:hypothetical protein [Marivita sp. S6314]